MTLLKKQAIGAITGIPEANALPLYTIIHTLLLDVPERGLENTYIYKLYIYLYIWTIEHLIQGLRKC